MLDGSLAGLVFVVASTLSQAGVGYLPEIKTEADFTFVANSGSKTPGVERSTKFIVPVRDNDPDLLPVLFQNVNKYEFHHDFLALEFPDKFPGLDLPGYKILCEVRVSRSYFACVIYRFKGDTPTYGFDIFTGDTPDELPHLDEAKWVYDHVTPKFSIAPIAYSPFRPAAIRNAETWVNPGFPINFAFGGGFGPYIAYTRTENFGRVKLLSTDEFNAANGNGEFSSQDILVLDEAPADIEGVIAGVITGSIQTELSHLSIRTGRRGTPNAYVRDARQAFTAYDGKLIHLVVGDTDYQVSEATLPVAEAWWSSHRPKPVVVPEIDRDYDQLDTAEDIPAIASLTTNGRYGGKGANFGRLWHIVPPEYRDIGFVIPIHYYIEYVNTTMVDSRTQVGVKVTLEQYIEDLLADPTFRGDSHTRFVELGNLEKLFRDGKPDPALVAKVVNRIQDVFGSLSTRARFRSSSNAEHLLEFNGAGLYDSTHVCAADEVDGDKVGPSICDPDLPDEYTVSRGLKKIWGSLWTFRGFEEREYFGIPQTAVGMGILCSHSFGNDEQVNSVGFTGNPVVVGDTRYLINCQKGDVEVVLPPPGVESEVDLLQMDGGQVKGIIRSHASNLVPSGQYVLSDDRLHEIGRVMSILKDGFPFDPGDHPPETILRDIEFKIDKNGQLIFKDIRLFVIVSSGPPAKDYHITVPDGFTLCGSFVESRPAPLVYSGKLKTSLRAGEHTLRTDGTTQEDLFEWLDLGPSGPRLEPIGPGNWKAELKDLPEKGRVWAFEFSQDFLNAGELIRLTINGLHLKVDGPTDITLDRLALTWNVSPYLSRLTADYGDPPDIPRHEDFLPCDMTHVPLYTVDVAFAGGDTLHLDERFQDLDEGTGPAELVHAEVDLTSFGGEARTVDDYWRLVYTAGHHNDEPYPEYWVLFDPPMEIAGIGKAKALQIVQGNKPPPPTAPPQVYLLGEDFSRIAQLEVVSLVRRKEGVNQSEFRRGDVDFDGQVRLTDPILILRTLFLGEGVIICPAAADVDDVGNIEITDAILILEYLYLGADPPAPPFPGCGTDPTPDDLPACVGPGCR